MLIGGPHCYVVSTSSNPHSKPLGWPNVTGFESWMVKVTRFWSWMAKIKLGQELDGQKWTLLFFFTGQLNVLAFHDSLFFARPTQRVGLLHCSQMDLIGFSLLAFPHAREILLEMLAIDSNRKLDAVQFFEHVCIPR